jgi:DNA replication protein DnaC
MTRRAQPPSPDTVTEQIRRSLRILGLLHTADKLDEHLDWAVRERPAPGMLLARVLGDEAACKLEQRIEWRIRQSGLRERKTLEVFNWAFQPNLDKALVLELAGLDFVRRKDDLIITGKSGTGKSHILQAIALHACREQMRVRYARCVDLLDDLYAGLADGTYPKRLRGWAAADFLVIDDVGLGQVRKRDNEPTAAHTLYDLIDRRHADRRSTALTSNIRLSAWGKYLGDPALAVAVLDRLSMNAIRLDIDGPSFRQFVAAERARARAAAGDAAPERRPRRTPA